jgi:hypothetical protein
MATVLWSVVRIAGDLPFSRVSVGDMHEADRSCTFVLYQREATGIRSRGDDHCVTRDHVVWSTRGREEWEASKPGLQHGHLDPAEPVVRPSLFHQHERDMAR